MLSSCPSKVGPGPQLGFFVVPKIKPQNIRATTSSETLRISSPQTKLVFSQEQRDASANSLIAHHMKSSEFASLPIKPAREDYELALSFFPTTHQSFSKDRYFPTSDMRSTANKGLGAAPSPLITEIDYQEASDPDIPMPSIENDIRDAKSRPRPADSPIDSVLMEDTELGGSPDQMEDIVLSDTRTATYQAQMDSTSEGTSGTIEPEHWPGLWQGSKTAKPFPMLERFENGHACIKLYDRYEGMLLSEDWVDGVPKEGVDWETYFAKALRELDELVDEWRFE